MSDAVMQVKTKPDRGFSLVELMIAMALGSLLVLLISDSYTKSVVSINKINDVRNLDAQLNNVAAQMTKEIKRAGFVNYNYERENRHLALYRYPLTVNGVSYQSPITIGPKEQCVLFFYDTNKNGCIGDKTDDDISCKVQVVDNEGFIGYKFDNNKIKYSPAKTNGCDSGVWQSMFDEKKIKVNDFRVKVINVSSVMSADKTTTLKFPVISLYIKASSVKNSSITRDVTKTIMLESSML